MGFTYRLTEVIYRNRIEREDGPGSLQNIVSDSHERAIKIWENMDYDFGDRLMRDGDPTLVLLPTSQDGRREYYYRLERRPTESDSWCYVGHLNSNRQDEQDVGDYPRDYFDVEEQETMA